MTYLAATGWTSERSDERRSIWRHASGVQVFIPATRGSDFDELALIALRDIARSENRDEEEIAIDVSWSRYDKLHVRRDAPASALHLDDALALHDALSDLIVAAARASSEPRASFSGRRPLSVESYLDQVRLIPSRPGSYVVRALLPLSDPPSQPELALIGPAAPAVRAISTTILRASAVAVQAARDVAGGAPLSTWEQTVASGCSSNLCDALSRLTGASTGTGGDDVEIGIHWTWTAPEQPAGPVLVPAGLAPVLRVGGDYLRGEPEEHSIRMTGRITKLHREAASGPGEITVRGHVENWDTAENSLRGEVDEQTYRLAIAAHDEGVSVRVSAVVRREPRGLTVLRVEDLDVLG